MKKRIVAWVMILVIGITNSQIVYAAEPETIDVEVDSGLQEENSEEREEEPGTKPEEQPGEQDTPVTDEEENSVETDKQISEKPEEEQNADVQEEENSNVQSAETNIFAGNSQVDNFVWDLYKADLYLRPGSVSNKNIAYALSAKMPAEVVTDHLTNNAIFQNSVGAWKAVHMTTDPSQITKNMLDEKGYYEAIIFSVFIGQQDNKEYISGICTSVSTETNQMISSIEKWVKESDNIDINRDIKIGSLSFDTQQNLKDYLKASYIKKHPFLDNTGMISEMINTFFKTTDTLGHAIENLSSYIKLSQISDDMKATLQEMYQKCPDTNVIFKQALSEAVSAMSSSEMALSTAIFNTAEHGAAEVAGAALKDFWKGAISSCPYAKAFMVGAEVGTCIGTSISNTLFSTDKTIEQYVKMKCLGEFITVLRSSITNLGTTYLGSKTIPNARNYFASIDAIYTAYRISCDFAQEYADILYKDASLGWIGISAADYNGYSKSVANIKQDVIELETMLEGSAKVELEGEYPDIYNILFGDHFNSIHVTGIAFEQDELTWGTKDTLLYLKAPTVYPEDAYNTRIKYSSSDSSILEIGEYVGSCTAHKPGTVTVTAESEDGGYTDSIIIHIIEGYGESGGSIGVSTVVDAGECGENVYWTLYSDGVLRIYGTGKMSYASNVPPWVSRRYEIKSVIVEAGVKNIGGEAFRNCSSLSKIVLPEGLTTIEGIAFWNCQNLSEIVLPKSVINIEYRAFEDCSGLLKVVMHEGVKTIGEYAFENCSNLSRIVLPEGLTEINRGLFEGCSNLLEVELPKSLTSIYYDAFKSCSSLSKIVLPGGLTKIGDEVFANCSSLTEIALPGGIRSIGFHIFEGCSSLSKVVLKEGITNTGGSSFANCSNLLEVSLPESMKSIDAWTFKDCSNLLEILLPQNVAHIETGSFYGCSSLSKIVLPKDVKSMGNQVFWNCSNLESLTMQGNAPETGVGIFVGCPKNMVIHVPKGATGYDVAPWTDYKIVYGGDNPDTTIYPPQNDVNTIINNIKSADVGSHVKAQMGTATVLPKKILQAMQDKDVDVSFTMDNNIVWEINGKDVKKDNLQDTNLLVDISEKEDGTIPEQKYSPIVGELPANQLSFVHEGSYGFDAKLTLAVDESYNTKKGVLLEYDGETASLVNSSIVKDGKVTLKVNKAQNCMLVYVLNGDVDQDNNVSIRDLMRTLHHVSNFQAMNVLQQGAADTDFNNTVNIQDLMRMLHYVSGKSSEL